jgi:hypothetical protein
MHVDHTVLQIDVDPHEVKRFIETHAGADQYGHERSDVVVALAQELLHFAGGLQPYERPLGHLEIPDELERVLRAPTLLDEIAVRRRERSEQRVDRCVADRLLALLERRAKIDQLRLRDLHERRAVERRAHVEPHAALVSSCERWSLIARSHASSASPMVRLWSTAAGRRRGTLGRRCRRDDHSRRWERGRSDGPARVVLRHR